MINCLRSIVSMRLPAIALFKFFNASYKLTESGTIATEMRSVLDRNHPVTGTVATETGGTMATETPPNSLAQHHRNDWHSMTEKAGTMATELSTDLPREEIVIEPDEDVADCKQIGTEVTEELEYTPGKFFVRQYRRPKYARINPEEGQAGVVIGKLPARFMEKGIAGPGLLAQILIDKYVDHLPLYRQTERFKRAGVNLPVSTVTDWVSHCCSELKVLYDAHRELVLSSGYLEGDETTIKVLDRNKKGKTHLGYYWVYRAPLENLVLFDYQQGRGGEWPQELLKDFQGYLQTDGYGAYDYLGKIEGITL